MKGLELLPDDGLRTKDSGRILLGGSPTTMLKLSATGAAVAKRWFGGEPLGSSVTEQALARKLLQTGMAHPLPPPSDLTYSVVIPVRDDPEGLATTLACLDVTGDIEVVVISDDAAQPLGPAAARNLGAADVTSDVIIFVDAGVEVEAGSLQRLVDHLAIENTAASAPRISARRTPGFIGTYEAEHSPLDLGGRPGLAAPRCRISYVPSTVLAIRRDAFAAVGGFDSSLRYGEDVDLVWRLAAVGATRYDPSVVATHPPRSTVTAFAHQRYHYGSSAGPLAKRHGDSVAPVVVSAWTVAAFGLALSRRFALSGLWFTGSTIGLARRLGGPTPVADATRLTLQGHWGAAQSIAKATTRTWWPLMIVGLTTPGRAIVGSLSLWGLLRHRSLLGLLDDLAYGAGVWRGTLRAKTARSVLPHVPEARAVSRWIGSYVNRFRS